jgi:hypothetical protein
MSAVAAVAATLPESVDEVPARRTRRRLRSVPSAAGPGAERSSAGNPLSIGRDARARLGDAVRALLDVASLEGASDAVRLAVLVLAARTPSETGVVEIRTSELGRWLGLSASYVASDVLPVLRRSGVVSVDTAEGEYGQDDGLKCKVLPLWAAQDVVGHPLNLAKKEFATLLRLVEAVMGPGWTHRDGRVTPAGLIGTRTGRGAATDRLALLLLVLEARETGRVRQCGGTVDTKRGRAAATVARLLGCTAAAGERVLERLEALGLISRVRVRTASGMAHRTRLVVPAVAAAHGRVGADAVREDRAEAPEPEFSDPDVAAGPVQASKTEVEPQVSSVQVIDEADVADPDVTAALHTDHPLLVTPVSSLSLSRGFSGEAGGVKAVGRSACACARIRPWTAWPPLPRAGRRWRRTARCAGKSPRRPRSISWLGSVLPGLGPVADRRLWGTRRSGSGGRTSRLIFACGWRWGRSPGCGSGCPAGSRTRSRRLRRRS